MKDDIKIDKNGRDVFNSWLVHGARFVGKYEFPLLKKTTDIAKRAIPFHEANRTRDREQWIHFYIDDYRFERVWNNPKRYLSILKAYKGVISPDFSVYMDMPLSMQIWNTYRNRALAFWMQSNGIKVIPNVQWGDERTYEFCFDGIPKSSTVAISTNGCIQNKIDRYYFAKGLAKMVEELKPDTIVNYSYTPNDIFSKYKEQGIEIIQIENYALTVRKPKVVV